MRLCEGKRCETAVAAMLAYVRLCSPMFAYAGLCSPMLAYRRIGPPLGSEIVGRESHWNGGLQVVLGLGWSRCAGAHGSAVLLGNGIGGFHHSAVLLGNGMAISLKVVKRIGMGVSGGTGLWMAALCYWGM